MIPSAYLHQGADPSKPGAQRELSIEHTGRNAELFQEEPQPVTPLQSVDEEQGFAPNQRELEQGIQQQEFVFFRLTDHLKLLQLLRPWQLGLL